MEQLAWHKEKRWSPHEIDPFTLATSTTELSDELTVHPLTYEISSCSGGTEATADSEKQLTRQSGLQSANWMLPSCLKKHTQTRKMSPKNQKSRSFFNSILLIGYLLGRSLLPLNKEQGLQDVVGQSKTETYNISWPACE